MLLLPLLAPVAPGPPKLDPPKPTEPPPKPKGKGDSAPAKEGTTGKSKGKGDGARAKEDASGKAAKGQAAGKGTPQGAAASGSFYAAKGKKTGPGEEGAAGTATAHPLAGEVRAWLRALRLRPHEAKVLAWSRRALARAARPIISSKTMFVSFAAN